jgi:spore coat polysaccharide biosynthesis protein SpsF
MRVVAILQARMNSSRLHGKMLLPLIGKPLLRHVIERTQRAKSIDAIVVTYPLGDGEAFVPIFEACRLRDAQGYATKQVFGNQWWDDPNDLVGRYLQAAITHNADIIVRIPCDNPCVDPAYIDLAVEKYLARPHIYVSTQYLHVHDRVYADGVGAEVFSLSRLQWLDQATTQSTQYREHPHLLFQDQHLIDGWEQYQRYANVSETIRLDVNDMPGYEFVKRIYDNFGNNTFTADEIVRFLDEEKARDTGGSAVSSIPAT